MYLMRKIGLGKVRYLFGGGGGGGGAGASEGRVIAE